MILIDYSSPSILYYEGSLNYQILFYFYHFEFSSIKNIKYNYTKEIVVLTVFSYIFILETVL